MTGDSHRPPRSGCSSKAFNAITGIAEDPEILAAFLLVVVAAGSEAFEAPDFGFDVVGFQVEVHPLLVGLGVGDALQQVDKQD